MVIGVGWSFAGDRVAGKVHRKWVANSEGFYRNFAKKFAFFGANSSPML